MPTLRALTLTAARSPVGRLVRQWIGPQRSRAIGEVVAPGPVSWDVAARARSRRSRRGRPGWRLDGRIVVPLEDRTPRQVADANLALAAELLESAGLQPLLVRTASPVRRALAVDVVHRPAVLAAIDRHSRAEPVYVQAMAGQRTVGPVLLADAATASKNVAEAAVIRVGRLYAHERGTLVLGLDYGCDIELWDGLDAAGAADPVLAPRPNIASDLLTGADVARVPITIADRCYDTGAVFGRTFLEEVTFPVDAVYTWVDGQDPAWRERMLRARAEDEGREYHAEADAESRFVDREELRYSLRSLSTYAPWFRHVYLVTDAQVPEWLDTTNPRITVVDHRDIFESDAPLPVFNSNAIISRLHHVPGLSEHYVYLNDDVFFGRDARPEQFFMPNGQARVFPARLHRPFGSASAQFGPHFNLTRNIRALLERELGVTVTRAIRHTPHPQLKSVHHEMEERFRPEYESTWASRFRHHDDIVADQLFHYYAQLTGRAVPSGIRYDYVNVGRADHSERLARLLRDRDRYVFCLNDAPEDEVPIMPATQVARFLEDYFPVPSEFERLRVGGSVNASPVRERSAAWFSHGSTTSGRGKR